MPDNHFPKSWNPETKPHRFCPGCGHGITTKLLGEVIDKLDIQDTSAIGLDIGCSLLAGDLFNVDSLQTHHGRTVPTMVGLKMAKPEFVALVYQGDGGAYAIGAQHLVNAVMRNDPITIIVINNTIYGMTGGQLAPTTLIGEKTTTTPEGRDEEKSGRSFLGPEMVASIAAPNSYIARGIVSQPDQLKNYLEAALRNQMEGNGISFVEVLSTCPTNWKTNARESLRFLEDKMAKFYKVGEFSPAINFGGENEAQD